MAQKIWTAEDLQAYGFTQEQPELYSITNAAAPHSESIDYRFKSYALKMLLRVVCIVCALFTDGWLMWVCILGAGVLPWVAVVYANGTDRARTADFSAYLNPHQQLQLASQGQQAARQEANRQQEEIIIDGCLADPTDEHSTRT
ncbi:MAG: DUF3099 domain-containing protein [Rothia sp. (in: high G+C Gram-positive bacteria)]|nr:DUF3099 domain-containing protein [Rothia sp. (in: high G+C Gram-positive bacteria)]